MTVLTKYSPLKQQEQQEQQQQQQRQQHASLVRSLKLKFVHLAVKVFGKKKRAQPQPKVPAPSLELTRFMIKSDKFGHYEITCPELMALKPLLVIRFGDRIRFEGNAITMGQDVVHECLVEIISETASINHLYLGCQDNGQIVKTIVEYFVENRRRFSILNLEVVGSSRKSDFEWFSKLVLLARRTLTSIFFTDVTIGNRDLSQFFWCSVGQCHKLAHLKYKATPRDKSVPRHVLEALEGKRLSTLYLPKISHRKR